MLVKLLSDLHLGGSLPLRYVDHGEHVCVLAGDIAEGMWGVDWAVSSIPQHIKVLYIPGNHEYYGFDYEALNARFMHHNSLGTHIQVLLNDRVRVGEVEFVGTTLWTDFNLDNIPIRSAMDWRKGLNDAIWISRNGHCIGPQDFLDWNAEALSFIDSTNKNPLASTRVLITHYCPDLSVAPKYKNSPLNPGFAMRIPVHLHKEFDFHFHGHTHDSMDYEYPYGTKVLCNPKGYGAENWSGFNEELVLDI